MTIKTKFLLILGLLILACIFVPIYQSYGATVLFPNGGGTGRATLTTGGVLYGNGIAPIGMTALCADGEIIKYSGGVPACGTDTSGAGGSSIIFDIGDDGGNDSIALSEIATSGDTNAIFTEPSADKLLIDLSKDWPKADTSDDLTCTNCIDATEIAELALGGTTTSGNYVATIADAGNATITVANSGTETAAITLDVIDVNCTACLSATELGADSVSTSELNGAGVESELEGLIDLQDLQGAVIDGQVPNNITIDLATLASTVTVVDGTDSTSFIGIYDSATGSLAPKTDGALLYDASNGTLTTTTVVAALTGNASTATALAADPADCVTSTHFAVGILASGVATCEAIADADVPNTITIDLATLASTETVVDSTDATSFVAMFDSATGSLAVKTDGGLLYASDTGTLAPTVLSTATVTLTGTGTINGLDAIDSTGEDTLEATLDLTGDVASTGLLNNVIQANAVALTTDTTGNYVAAVTTSVLTGLTGGNVAAEGTTSALAFDYSQALSGDVGLVTKAGVFGQNGFVFEGTTADTIETYVSVTDPTASDKTITIPDRSGTISLSGDTFTGDVTATLSSSGATALTVAADAVALTTDTTGNYVSSATASGGLVLTGTEGGSLGVLLPAATDALSSSTSKGSGLELISAGLTMLQGCSDGQILKWVESTDTWDCSADANSGGATAWDAITDPTTSADVAFAGLSETISGNTNDVTAIAQDLLALNYTNDAGTDILTQRLLVLNNASATGGTTETLLALDNKDDSAVTTGISIIGSSTGAITTAIDASDAEIGTALSVGANDIVGTTGLINLNNFDVDASGNIVSAGDITLSGGDLLTGNIALRVGDAATDTITLTTDGTGTGEVVLPDESISTAEITNATITTTDISGSAGITAAQTALTAGRSLTFSTNDILADVELYTSTACYRLPASPVATDDDKSIWINDTANGFTITRLWAESDQTTTMMIQVDDGTPSDVDTVDLAPAAGTASDTSLNGDVTVAAGDRIDLDVASVASTPTWAVICWTGTWDD